MPTPEWFSQLIERELSPWAHLAESQLAQLFRHYELLFRWNERMNLTTVKPGEEAVIRHYCESLFFAIHLPSAETSISILDVGSGPGFPGVPLAILEPEWRVTLVESHQRKAVFLRESTRSLKNVWVRAERMQKLDIRADWVVARAVDPAEVIENSVRLATRIGLMLGEDDFSLINRNSRIAWEEPVRLPWGDRRLCVYGTVCVPRET